MKNTIEILKHGSVNIDGDNILITGFEFNVPVGQNFEDCKWAAITWAKEKLARIRLEKGRIVGSNVYCELPKTR